MGSDLISLTEWCENNGKQKSVALLLIKQGRLPGAKKLGAQWVVPTDTPAPPDGRVKSGKFKNWRKKPSV